MLYLSSLRLSDFLILQLWDSLHWLNVPSQPAKAMKFIILCSRYTWQGGVHSLLYTKDEL